MQQELDSYQIRMSCKIITITNFAGNSHTMRMDFEVDVQELVVVEVDAKDEDLKSLVVYNDDFNTFEHVINTLIKVCKHDAMQAEQCTYLIHYKGKCSVKTGSYAELKPMREGITEAGIKAIIE